MTQTKEFAIADVLTVVTGVMLSRDFGDVLNWMTGESVFVHQTSRICGEAAPVILADHPEFQAAIDEAEKVTSENWSEWLATWTDRYGVTVAVPKLTIAEHERIDPMSEAAEHFPPDKIIVVKK